MKEIIKFISIFVFSILLFGCKIVPFKKELHFFNNNFETEIIIIDKNNNKHEFNIEPEWSHMWSEELIGDFNFIYIKNGNGLEGIFIIKNNYNKKSYEIISRKEYKEWILSEYNNDDRVLLYEILLQPTIKNEIFIVYNKKYFEIEKYFNYEDNYLAIKEKYFKEYNLE